MPETRGLRSVVEAAAQAAAAGDYASAEQFLREAVFLQEADLGPLHPDLANTLNNLGVVCDITDKPVDAELCYRRACTIATAVLEPDHPFVATSRKNLRDFCEARGKAVELPTPPRSSHPLAIGAIGACGLVFVMFIAIRPWFGSNQRAATSPGSATQSLPESPTSTVEPLPVGPISLPTETATNSGGSVGVRKHRAPGSSALAPPTVAEAHLCRDLSTAGSHSVAGDWQCDRASLPVDPGSLFFYSRIKSEGDTTVQHRWYRGDHLRKDVELRIRANSTSGYRTYSRNIVDNRSGGDWRVELRTKDGILLHEERFVVR